MRGMERGRGEHTHTHVMSILTPGSTHPCPPPLLPCTTSIPTSFARSLAISPGGSASAAAAAGCSMAAHAPDSASKC